MILLYSCAEDEPRTSLCGKVSRATLPPEFYLFRMVKDLLKTPIQWRDEIPASEWPGVHLDPSGEVTAIQWNALELHGPMHWENIPASLIIFDCGGHRTQCNYLTWELQLESLPQGLIKLDLSKNELRGELETALLPRSLENLHHPLLVHPFFPRQRA